MRRPRNGERPTPAEQGVQKSVNQFKHLTNTGKPDTSPRNYRADRRPRSYGGLARPRGRTHPHAENGDLDAIMEAESAVVAYLIAADALREWRGAA